MNDRSQLNITIKKELLDETKRRAEELGQTLSYYVRAALTKANQESKPKERKKR